MNNVLLFGIFFSLSVFADFNIQAFKKAIEDDNWDEIEAALPFIGEEFFRLDSQPKTDTALVIAVTKGNKKAVKAILQRLERIEANVALRYISKPNSQNETPYQIALKQRKQATYDEEENLFAQMANRLNMTRALLDKQSFSEEERNRDRPLPNTEAKNPRKS